MTTIIVGAIAYIFGALTSVVCISCLMSGKQMDQKLRMDEEEHEVN